MKITNLEDFKIYEAKRLNEALSVDRKKDAKLKILVQEARELIEAKMKLKEIAELRKIKNNELKEALEDIKEAYIIAKDVLFEIIKPYERKGLDTKAYIKFVEESTDEVTKEFMKVHNIALELAKMDRKGYTYFSQAKNTKNLETGTIVESKLMDFLKRIYNKLKNAFKSFKTKMNDITEKSKAFSVNDAVSEAVDYVGRKSVFKDSIIELLTEHNELNYTQFIDMIAAKLGYEHNIDLSVFRNLKQLLAQGVLNRKKKPGQGKTYFYFLTNETDAVDLIDNDPSIETQPDEDAIVAILEQAYKSIELAEEEKYYKALIESKEATVEKMLKEMNATKIAIDDKILSLVTRKDSKYTDWATYQEVMLTGKTVSSNVKGMAKSLFETYEKVTQVSGSIRQFDNDADLPEGTTGATFDWVLKKVVAKEDINENLMDIFKKVGRYIKNLFNKFFNFAKRANLALSKL